MNSMYIWSKNFSHYAEVLNNSGPKMSISSSCNKSVKIRFVATCHLQTCYNLLKQRATSLLK